MPNEKKYLQAQLARDKQWKEKEGIEAELTKAVNSPSHYTQNGIETIDMIKESLTEEEFSGYLKGNILKYVCRYKHKGMPLKDLMKSQWYLQRLVSEQRENEK
jgi:hypothetical protein